jgi:lipid-A-disaccharide synthase
LPGSRTHEVEMNFLTQLRAAEIIHRTHPETRFLVAGFKESHCQKMEAMRRQYPTLPIEIYVNRTPEIIQLSKACVSVSGSVSMELLYRVKPTVIVYRVTKFTAAVFGPLLKVKYITLVNLLADKMLYPEFLSMNCESVRVAEEILKWLDDERVFAAVTSELQSLVDQVAAPGACDRTARCILDRLAATRSAVRGAA